LRRRQHDAHRFARGRVRRRRRFPLDRSFHLRGEAAGVHHPADGGPGGPGVAGGDVGRRETLTPARPLHLSRRSGPAGAVMTTATPRSKARKKPFDLVTAIRRLRATVRPLPKAALFVLAENGYRSVFELLVACIISIRTRDETTVPVAQRLF